MLCKVRLLKPALHFLYFVVSALCSIYIKTFSCSQSPNGQKLSQIKNFFCDVVDFSGTEEDVEDWTEHCPF